MKKSGTSTTKKVISSQKRTFPTGATKTNLKNISKSNVKKVVKNSPQNLAENDKNNASKKNVQRKKNVTNSSKKVVSNKPKKIVSNVKPKSNNINNNNKPKVKINNADIEKDNVIKLHQQNLNNFAREYEYDENKSNLEIKIRPITLLKIFLSIGLCICIIYILLTHEVFNLNEISVEGNEKYTDEEIINQTTLTLGKNVFLQLFNNDINLPYIYKANFVYSFPDSIVIKVEERYPEYIALDKNTGKYYMLDNEGYLLEECDLESITNELLVEGFVFEEEVQMGSQINDVYLYKLNIYNTIKELLETYNIQGTVTKVKFESSLTTITLDDKLSIVFSNSSDLNYKVYFLSNIIEQSEITEGTINMSVDNPVYSAYD